MFEIRKYTADKKEEWNKFVNKAKNSTFLFDRNYMDYHSDRFNDNSLMFYKKGKLYALLPAHKIANVLYSHFGLTYGGLIMDVHVTITNTCILFTELNEYLKDQGFKKVIYRPIPWIYCKHASEEDLYAIFWKCHARLLTRNIGT
ncbi:MAG: GNAT family N-acetyltransferase, partial [Prevotella sp.]|nr:GNAT family N-acetyltransferase [Prevotella sp.]